MGWRFQLAANIGLKLGGQRQIIKLLMRTGVFFKQVGYDHRRAAIVGHQIAGIAATGGTVANHGDLVGIERLGRHRAADHILGLKAFLGQLIDAGIWCPQRLH